MCPEVPKPKGNENEGAEEGEEMPEEQSNTFPTKKIVACPIGLID